MKRIVSIILLIILALSSCSHISSQKEQSSSSPGSLDTFDTEQVLNLSEDQKYDIWDYKDNIVLFLVSNLSKQNPSDINDQLTTTYYEAFILYDLLNESIVTELPIEKFGILSSALLAYDGVLFSLFEVTSEKNMESFIYFLNGHEMTSIYQGPYSPFNMGPILVLMQVSFQKMQMVIGTYSLELQLEVNGSVSLVALFVPLLLIVLASMLQMQIFN